MRRLISMAEEWCYTCMRPKKFCDMYGCDK